ncbi:MAG TPA: acyl-CoA desaturase [Polyangia bacterium]|jgi:stearoyl-CoA desaturase (delta-9 desaturase)|nr:acyl-CoA desaturase [Polyangia bacterium]
MPRQALGALREDRLPSRLVVLYLGLVHVLAGMALFLPLRPGYVAAALGVYLSVGLGTTVGLHRLLSHRSFACPRWLEYVLVSLAMTTGQGSPLLWVANHRIHHGHSDGPGDIHSPRHGFWYSHVGWIYDSGSTDPLAYQRYCRDLADDRYYHWLVPYRMVPQLVAVLLVALIAGWGAVPFVFFLPVVCWMHSTYAVNSVCHWPSLGTRRFATRDDSRNVWWVGLLALGEGWHNNHHASPRAARHGLGWHELDLSYWFIRLLACLGLSWQLVEPARATRRTRSSA